ncbi:MAG: hypothetical protein WD096_02910 [Actinomycetota bacterium]
MRAPRAAAAAVVASVALVASVAFARGSEPIAVRRLTGVDPDSVLSGGERTSIEEARLRFPVPLLLPQTTVDNDETIAEIWVRLGNDPEAYVIYASGLHAIVESASRHQPVGEFIRAQVADGSLMIGEQILGYDAAIIDPIPAEGFGGNVRAIVGDSVVVIIGNEGSPARTFERR